MALGPKVVLLDSLVVVTITTAGYWLGTRWLKLDRDTAILTSAGSAICGAAAVLATEGTIRSRPAATSMAVATVVLFGKKQSSAGSTGCCATGLPIRRPGWRGRPTPTFFIFV